MAGSETGGRAPTGDAGRSQNRLERRKQRTRAALIRAAQDLMAAGRLNVPVQDICQVADVGVGSFYNHFDSKEELFLAAVNEVLDAHGALLDELTASVRDPAEVFAQSFRLTGRLFRRRPAATRILLGHGLALVSADRGLGPRARRDIAAAAATGRFHIADPELAMAVAAGALLGLGQLLHDQPDRDSDSATDQVAGDVLRLFGMTPDEAQALSYGPLPDLDAIGDAGSAA